MRAETEAAISAVQAAQRVVADFGDAFSTTEKGTMDVVTEVDIAAEDVIRTELERRVPGVPIVGEERGGDTPLGGAYWLVDPICGTKTFAAGISLYCINVALVENGTVMVAAVGEGGSSKVYVAERDNGAWEAGQPDRRLMASDASAIVLADTGGPRFDRSTEHAVRFIHAALQREQWFLWMYSSTVNFPYLAAGRIAGTVYFRMSSALHFAAGCLLADEAGVILTDLDGKPWDLDTRAFVAAGSPLLHAELLQLVAETRP